jgi:predicted DNA-binding transcriptional regulator AlpA
MNNMMPMTYMARADFGGPVLMTATDVYAYLGVSKSFFYKHIRYQSSFPQPVDFFATDRWRKADIDDWVHKLKN